ncbi:MAG: 5-formyltetrahydrofolate cyclo-ligase [Halobacteriaceae archaeon]
MDESADERVDKQALRESVWDALEREGVARFPYPPHGRIPNVAGADTAAERLAATDAWVAADVLKVNPDAPQLPVRRAALRAGKTLYVPVPRLSEAECFYRLDPDAVADVDAATTVSGVADAGVAVPPGDVEPVDLIVSGSVAVRAADGTRVGKGEGYSDLEFALLREYDRVDDETVTATTVHERQVVEEPVAAGAHDVPMDLVVTPERTIRPARVGADGTAGTDGMRATQGKPSGVDREALDPTRREEIPALAALRER